MTGLASHNRPLRLLALGATWLAVALALLGATRAVSAHADSQLLSVMQDDNQLVYGTPQQRDAALNRMRGLGVDAVRVTVLWQALANSRKPKRKSPSSPAAYPPSRWDRYDGLVRGARARGISVYFSVTAPGPRWAHAESPRRSNQRTWKPSPREFGRFYQAVATRYSGTYRDENEGKQIVPRVSWWGLFNEPNQGGWLTPQSQVPRGFRTPVPSSPALYRSLAIAAAGALLRTGHANDIVLLGETAPLGKKRMTATKPLAPKLFLRELFCLDKRLRKLRGRAARARNCGNVKRLRVLSRLKNLSYGHHPYTKTLPPRTRDSNSDSISMANLAELPRYLDSIARRTRLIPVGMRVFLTEFGYETNPPDPLYGVPLDTQARYLNDGDFIAYHTPRVVANTQFQLFDVPPQAQYRAGSRRYWFTYQSGLFRADGVPKPSATAYLLPFQLQRLDLSNRNFLVWGQVRFTPNGHQQTVYLQTKPTATAAWKTVGPIKVTNPYGYYETTQALPAGSFWRAFWASDDFKQVFVSREIQAQ